MNRFWKMRVLLAVALTWTAAETTTYAGLFKRTACDDCNPCVNPCVPATPQMVTRTIYVPEYTTEKRVVRETVCKPVQKERIVTVMECVPETKMVEQCYTAIEKRQQTRTVRYTVQKPVFETQTRQVQVQVPVWETKQVDYQVSVPVRREVEKTFVVNVKHREQRRNEDRLPDGSGQGNSHRDVRQRSLGNAVLRSAMRFVLRSPRLVSWLLRGRLLRDRDRLPSRVGAADRDQTSRGHHLSPRNARSSVYL